MRDHFVDQFKLERQKVVLYSTANFKLGRTTSNLSSYNVYFKRVTINCKTFLFYLAIDVVLGQCLSVVDTCIFLLPLSEAPDSPSVKVAFSSHAIAMISPGSSSIDDFRLGKILW